MAAAQPVGSKTCYIPVCEQQGRWQCLSCNDFICSKDHKLEHKKIHDTCFKKICQFEDCEAESTSKCRGCKELRTYYCSEVHQRRAWKDHKVDCRTEQVLSLQKEIESLGENEEKLNKLLEMGKLLEKLHRKVEAFNTYYNALSLKGAVALSVEIEEQILEDLSRTTSVSPGQAAPVFLSVPNVAALPDLIRSFSNS